MPKLACDALESRTRLLSLAAVLLVLRSSSALATDSPAALRGPCPFDRLQEVSLEEGRTVVAPNGFDKLAFYDTTTSRSLKDLSKFLKKNAWTIKDDDLTFEATQLANITGIVLAWTKRIDGANSAVCLQAIQVPAITTVTKVYRGVDESTASAKLGDPISIEVQDLDPWIRDHSPRTVSDLVPFFDGAPLHGIHPENPVTEPEGWRTNFHSYTKLRFTLERNASNREVWKRLLYGLTWGGRPLNVSLGIEGGDPLSSWVVKDRPSSSGPDYKYYRTFTLEVLPHSATLVAAALFAAALLAFLWLAKATEILQDVNAALRPDGRAPYSLARVQMAFWFFLVVAAWFLLFLVMKDIDTLTTSVLILMGISAGTAVGSAMIDAGTSIDSAERIRNVPVDQNGLEQRIAELRDNLAITRALVVASEAERGAVHAEVAKVAAELSLAESQQAFLGMHKWLRATYDLLGDEGHISFHRFQIAVWTLVLGVVFVMKLLSELAMPEFSATVLGLMGISSGTYLGFKLPATSVTGAQAKG